MLNRRAYLVVYNAARAVAAVAGPICGAWFLIVVLYRVLQFLSLFVCVCMAAYGYKLFVFSLSLCTYRMHVLM
jgi:hypothetical protein